MFGFGGKKIDTADALIVLLKEQIKDLNKEKEKLMSMLEQAYNALAAKESPQYYAESKVREATPLEEKKAKRIELENKFFNEYLKDIESNEFFKDPADLRHMFQTEEAAEDIISKVATASADPLRSMHGNDES